MTCSAVQRGNHTTKRSSYQNYRPIQPRDGCQYIKPPYPDMNWDALFTELPAKAPHGSHLRLTRMIQARSRLTLPFHVGIIASSDLLSRALGYVRLPAGPLGRDFVASPIAPTAHSRPVALPCSRADRSRPKASVRTAPLYVISGDLIPDIDASLRS